LKGRKNFWCKNRFFTYIFQKKTVKKSKTPRLCLLFKGLQMVELKKRREKWHSSNNQRFKMVYKETNNKM